MLASTDKLAGDYVKSHSGRVQDVMTRDVISVTEMTPVADISALLETNRIKRVPVLRDGKLVGIVSRANLVRALAMTVEEQASATEADDRSIRDRLLAELKAQRWTEVSPANVTVKDGVVHLWSSYCSEQEKRELVVAAESIPGVRRSGPHEAGSSLPVVKNPSGQKLSLHPIADRPKSPPGARLPIRDRELLEEIAALRRRAEIVCDDAQDIINKAHIRVTHARSKFFGPRI